MKKYTKGLNVDIYTNPSNKSFEEFKKFAALGIDENSFLAEAYNKSYKTDRFTSIANKAPFSLANRYALFTWYGMNGIPQSDVFKYYKDSINNQLTAPDFSREPTLKRIIEFFSEQYAGMDYSWSDFLWTKWNNKISNNHLLTLRRFASPVDDNIYDPTKSILTDNNGLESVDLNLFDLSRAVTWMDNDDSTGNSMDDLLHFTYGYNYKEQTAETNTMQSNDEGYTAQPFYDKMGRGGKALVDLGKGISPGEKARRKRMSGHDPLKETYENFVFGPVNVINKMQTRDVGLNFEHNISLKFDYSLKSYGGINPKVAFLDVFSNLLVLTYSNANFWGGANRFYGANGFVGSRFGNTHKLANGDYKGYLGSVVSDMGSSFKSAFGNSNGEMNFDSVLGGLKDLGGEYLGSLLGGFLNKQLGAAPAFQAMKGLITGESTGNWHLTVGNPLNPIALIGNLILTNSEISFKGPLGYDDFPSSIHMEATLKHARPRDKSDFESMFNGGMGRMYASSEEFDDVLNTRGYDVAVYGAFQSDRNKKPHSGNGDDGSKVFRRDLEKAYAYSSDKAGIKQSTTNNNINKVRSFQKAAEGSMKAIASNNMLINS